MRKINLKFLLIVFFMLLIFPFSVEAKVTCSEIEEEVENYNNIVSQMENLTCDNVQDEELVSQCNDYNIKKAYSLSKIFSYNDTDTKCSKKNLKAIVDENKDLCTNVFGTDLKNITNGVMNIFYVVAPFLLIIFGMIDFSNIVTAGDPIFRGKDESGNLMASIAMKSRKRFVRRLISFILIFFIPVIANFILNFNVVGITYDTNVYSCKSNVLFHLDRWETTYIPQTTTTSNGNSLSSGSASDIVEAAGKVHEQQKNEYHYSVGGDLFWNNIEKSLNNPNKVTCCATFVGSALYVAGIFTEDEMNSYNYNLASGTSDFLASKGWQKITNYSDLQAGDIVFMTSGSSSGIGHTQIYAGNGTWYNAGGNCSIQDKGCGFTSSPYASDASGRFIHAYRKP